MSVPSISTEVLDLIKLFEFFFIKKKRRSQYTLLFEVLIEFWRARTSRSQEVINNNPLGNWGVKKVQDLGGPMGSPPAIPRIIEYDLLGRIFCNRFTFSRIHVFICHLVKIQRHDWNSIDVGSNFTVARVAKLSFKNYNTISKKSSYCIHILKNLECEKKIRDIRERGPWGS